MEKIASFKIDHTRLLRGIYVSRKDYLEGGDVVTTFDIRMKLPNREPAVSQSALHTIEHLAATYLRNHPHIVSLMQELFQWIADFDGEIPGANAHDCGNYMLNNLPMAKWEARKYYIEVLQNIQPQNLVYPED